MPDRDDRPGPDEPLTPTESRLLGWRPSPGGLDRDRMLFEAGRASATGNRTRLGPWSAATALLAMLSLGLGLALIEAKADRDTLRRDLVALRSRADEAVASPIPPAREPASDPDPPTIEVEPIDPEPSSYLALARRLASGDPIDPEPPIDRDHGAGPLNVDSSTLRVGGSIAALGL